MKFMLPRLLGLTIIAGIATLLMSLIFKVLIGATIIGAVVHFAIRRFSRRQINHGYQHHPVHGAYDNGRMERTPFHPFGNDVVPVSKMQRNSGIVPIN